MPEISRFYGIIIRMFTDEHNPPHFHAYYGNYTAAIDIRTGNIMYGKLPKKQTALITAWALIHQKELLKNWNELINGEEPQKINPLK